jgi:rhamnose transport system ATP-binding protein
MSLLTAHTIHKSFAGVHALRGVSFDLRPGEIHALVGENGAGKSTLIRIITGAETPDDGSLTIDGTRVDRFHPSVARALGVAAIYQQPALFPDLTVSENIALALESRRPWTRIDWKGRRHRAATLLDRIGATIDPDRLVASLSLPEQQLVEIAKVVGTDARVVLMDEPTASLTDREVERLLEAARRLQEHGTGIIYISHRLEEVFALANRITVLRDGESIATRDRDAVSRAELVRLMVGRELSAVFPRRGVRPVALEGPDTFALELRQISSRAAGLRDVSLSVRRGEIVGLSGLVGSGRTALAETIFGLRALDSGQILVDGIAIDVTSPSDAMRHGIGYVPEDRRRHGVVSEMSIAVNTSLATLPSVSRMGIVDSSKERDLAERYQAQLRIKTSSVLALVRTLSGGNQQKVALARWLAATPSVLILDEPTQGVDVGSKAEIHAIMQGLAEQGLAILLISSELPEILGMADRIAVMHGGAIKGQLTRQEATAERIMALALDRSAAGQVH